nr:hypothetical protein BdHM001_29800 [Bdellovibrio sp. HM001]
MHPIPQNNAGTPGSWRRAEGSPTQVPQQQPAGRVSEDEKAIMDFSRVSPKGHGQEALATVRSGGLPSALRQGPGRQAVIVLAEVLEIL